MTHFPPVFALPPPAAPALPASVANSSYPARLMACLEKIQLYSAPQPTGFPRRDTSSSISATGEGSQSAAAQNIAVSFPNTPLAVPDRTSSLQMREVRALPVEGAQKLAGSASFISQVYQEADAPPAAVNSVEGQRMGGVLPQSALPGASRSRANIRWAAADAATNQHELSPEGAAPVTPAPTIQVTIGRIEVRATQPPPAQRQVPRPGPRMVSLEEYLDRQAKGGQ